MTKKRIIIETITFSLILIISYIAIFIVLFFSSRDQMRINLQADCQVAERIFDGSNPTVTGEEVTSAFKDNDYRISIITREKDGEYTIIYDSHNMYQSNEDADELDNIDDYTTRKSSYGYSMVYYVMRDEQNPSYYIRAAIRESNVSELSYDFLLYGSIALIIILFFYGLYKYKAYINGIKPLKEEVQRLAYISNIDDTGEEDLQALTESIDVISNKLVDDIKALTNEREKTKNILDSVSQAIIAISNSGNIALYNLSASKLFNYEEKEAINENYHILNIGDEFNKNLELVLQGKIKTSTFDCVIRNIIYSCEIIHTDSSWLDSGKIGAVILFSDVDEERRINKIKNDFFSNASHELKTPLTSILGYLELIDKGILQNEDEKEAISESIKEAKKMKDLLKDMLIINNLDSNKQLKKEEVSLKETIDEIISSLRPLLLSKEITITTNKEDFTILADKKDIERLLINLIENAIKYNKDKGKITITLNSNDKTFKIEDTGIGISSENINRIFERFYRVDNSKTEKNIEGTGLGLAICKHIAQLYDYQIEVQSKLAVGTTFIVHFK